MSTNECASKKLLQLRQFLEIHELRDLTKCIEEGLGILSLANLVRLVDGQNEQDDTGSSSKVNMVFISEIEHRLRCNPIQAHGKFVRLQTALGSICSDYVSSYGIDAPLVECLISADILHCIDEVVAAGISRGSQLIKAFSRDPVEFCKDIKASLEIIPLMERCFNKPRREKERRRVACSVGDSSAALIEFERFIWAGVIDSKAMQRLRKLRQTGKAHLVYPNATHSRFEHSLGVAHLAGRMFDSLAEPLAVTKRESKRLHRCAVIAALCHDLGHGPYSHTFEAKFARSIPGREDWRHEEMSLRLFEEQIANRVPPSMEAFFDSENVELIKNMMTGVAPPSRRNSVFDDDHMNLTRASLNIVANKSCGLDVDRLDYLSRDGAIVGEPSMNFATRLTQFCRAVNGEIAWHIREDSLVRRAYIQRQSLFERIYHHRKLQAIELMMVEILQLLDPLLKFGESLDDTDAYLNVHEYSVEGIIGSNRIASLLMNPRDIDVEVQQAVKRAEAIHNRVELRDVYRFCSELVTSGSDDRLDILSAPPGSLEDDIIRYWPCRSPSLLHTDSDTSLRDNIVTNVFRRPNMDGLQRVKFFTPNNLDAGAFTVNWFHDAADFDPNRAMVRLYSKVNDPTFIADAKSAFKSWSQANSLQCGVLEGNHRPEEVSPTHSDTPFSSRRSTRSNADKKFPKIGSFPV